MGGSYRTLANEDVFSVENDAIVLDFVVGTGFETAICHTDTLGASAMFTASYVVSDGVDLFLPTCPIVSDPITVNFLTADDAACATPCEEEAGTIATTDGLTELTICAGDGVPDAFTVEVTGDTATNYTFVITDPDGNILSDGPVAGPDFDLEEAGAGTCLVWGVAYSGDLVGVEQGLNAADIEGCFDLSNAITVTRLTGDDCPVEDCEGVVGGSALPGTACDDGDPNTNNDTWTADCECVGELPEDCEGVPAVLHYPARLAMMETPIQTMILGPPIVSA